LEQTVLLRNRRIDRLMKRRQDWPMLSKIMTSRKSVRIMAQDVIAMYPNATLPVIGREANRETWKQAFQIYESHPLTVDHVFAANSRDVGYSYGRWAASGVPGVGEVAGRYIVTWAWTKSGWQIIHISAHIHEDVPPSEILVQ
jgi:ketosteroid isomerase-like protein